MDVDNLTLVTTKRLFPMTFDCKYHLQFHIYKNGKWLYESFYYSHYDLKPKNYNLWFLSTTIEEKKPQKCLSGKLKDEPFNDRMRKLPFLNCGNQLGLHPWKPFSSNLPKECKQHQCYSLYCLFHSHCNQCQETNSIQISKSKQELKCHKKVDAHHEL